MTDSQLLQQRSQEAFAQLVARHADWVYSLAVRRLNGDAHLAEDVTQAVFLLLWQKAGKLGTGATTLNAWLFKTTQYACSNALRMKMRRAKHEQHAAAMNTESLDTAVDRLWDQISPTLDEMVGRLRSHERDALLLRFYQQKSMAEVGAALGVSEDAAKKRVARAVESLREALGRKGVSVPAGVIAAPLLIKLTQAAPASLIASCALPTAAKTAGILSIVKGTLMATMKMKLVTAAVIVGCLAFATGVAVVIVSTTQPETAATSAPATLPSNPPVARNTTRSPNEVTVSGGRLLLGTVRQRPTDNELITRNRVKCAANLKGIGQALLLYANEHRGGYPADFGTLCVTEDILPDLFVCPSTGKNGPNWRAMSPAEITAWVNANSDYVFLGPGLSFSEKADMVIAYEKDENEYGDGMNILYGDGHVDFQRLEQAHAQIEASKAILLARKK